MSVSIFMNYNFRQEAIIYVTCEIYNNYGSLVLYECNYFLNM